MRQRTRRERGRAPYLARTPAPGPATSARPPARPRPARARARCAAGPASPRTRREGAP
jgi:hypothetical protein